MNEEEKLKFFLDLQSGKLELGSVDISAREFGKWLKEGGYRYFKFTSWEKMQQAYKKHDKPLESENDIAALIQRMKQHKTGRLILAKAMTEIRYGNLTDDEKWKLYKQTEKLGYCPLCGWKDGEGVKVCYYSDEIGAVIHQNSWEWVLNQMSESQRSLIKSYESHKSGVMDEKTCNEVRNYLAKIAKREGDEWRIGCCTYSAERYKTAEQAAEAWIGERRSLEKHLAEGYVIRGESQEKPESWTIFKNFKPYKTYTVQKPHICGGFGTYKGPYHIVCSRCREEVKLWEFGIDYDVG